MAYVYIMTDKPYGTLYIGVTNNLARRVYEHQNGLYKGFTQKYGLKILVYYEVYDFITIAIMREKAMKFWRRAWKINHIELMNPTWRDLAEDLNS